MNPNEPTNLPTQIVTQKCRWCGLRVGASVPIPYAAWFREQKLRNAMLAHERTCAVVLDGDGLVGHGYSTTKRR